MATGVQHSLVIAIDGDVYAFGLNDAAQLEPGDNAAAAAAAATNASCGVVPCRAVPTQLSPGWLFGGQVAALAAGRYHSLALLSDGAGSNPNPIPNPDPNPNPNPSP
jgi:alpha-tubulin suppressor-like RCC1 family protein